jgi:multicomponent Na+:H+ antiporter subunit E
VTAWVLLWGRLSVANVLSGVVVVTALLVLFPVGGRRARSVVRPLAVARLAAFFVVQLVKSNVDLTRTILAPRDRVRTGVIAVPMEETTDGILTLVVDIAMLTPGTLVVEVQRDPTVLYVHVMALRDRDAVVHELRTCQRLAMAAFAPRPAVGSSGGAS